jgi:hypothetical protein
VWASFRGFRLQKTDFFLKNTTFPTGGGKVDLFCVASRGVTVGDSVGSSSFFILLLLFLLLLLLLSLFLVLFPLFSLLPSFPPSLRG